MDTDALYLIAHKMRGQVALDVALRFAIGDEDVWMIPTSGHRAYPFEYKPLAPMLGNMTKSGEEWATLRDHYPKPARYTLRERVVRNLVRMCLRSLAGARSAA